jgi:hypothetical protein
MALLVWHLLKCAHVIIGRSCGALNKHSLGCLTGGRFRDGLGSQTSCWESSTSEVPVHLAGIFV